MSDIKEKDLAYGGQALIEGVLMRGSEGYAYTVKQPDGNFVKEKFRYKSLGSRFKVLGFPFIRGIVGFFENMVLGMKVLNKSAEIAFPEEQPDKKTSGVTMFFTFMFALMIAMLLFVGLPYFLTQFIGLDHNENYIMYNLVSGVIRMVFFFVYLILISLMEDTKRLFGYHGAEHKTIHTYEDKAELTVENVKKHSRLHPRCGTSFIFIVFLITIIVFPVFNIILNSNDLYNKLESVPVSIDAEDYGNDLTFLKERSNAKPFFSNKSISAEDVNLFDTAYEISNDSDEKFVLVQGLTGSETKRLKELVTYLGYNKLGRFLQNIIIILSHIFVGMPIVASISYEMLKLSGKFRHNFFVKIFVAPGLFFQLFTTREPDDTMIEAAISSLQMVLDFKE